MSERSQELFLSDILESIDAIQLYVISCDFDFFVVTVRPFLQPFVSLK